MKKVTLLLLISLCLLINQAKAQPFSNYTVASANTSLPSIEVTAIGLDAQGNKWFCTTDGVSKLSIESSSVIKPALNENQLRVYPNPVQNVLYINLPGKTGMLEVINISGKSLLLKEIRENNTSVDVSGLDNGIYIVKVLSDKQMLIGKFLKF